MEMDWFESTIIIDVINDMAKMLGFLQSEEEFDVEIGLLCRDIHTNCLK